MKIVCPILITLLFSPIISLAQNPKNIEKDLLKTFDRIEYWFEKGRDSTFDIIVSTDSLEKANEIFSKKLNQYASKYAFTIDQKFLLLGKKVDISSSSDGLFRIYSWDTWTGGTMHFFESVFQYKVGNKTYSILDTPKTEGDNRPNYRKVYTFKINNHTYYLCNSIDIGSTKDFGESLQVFAIEKGKLNQDVRIIKTGSGMHNILGYFYDSSLSNRDASPISFDKVSKTIRLPLISSNGKVKKGFIAYKFTGQYFERVKN